VQTLFKTFHRKKSTRQSIDAELELIPDLFRFYGFLLSGELLLISGSSAAFMVVLIFLFIIGLIMTIVSVKSR